MVSFVKPKLLGNVKEFYNRFVNPITNGQNKDSSQSDVKLMKKRAHVLYNTLESVVQRKDSSYFKLLLPEKREYVLSIRLSPVQIELYKGYFEKRGYTNLSKDYKASSGQLFNDFQSLSRIWTHPRVLKMKEELTEKAAVKKATKLERNLVKNNKLKEAKLLSGNGDGEERESDSESSCSLRSDFIG